MSMLQPKCTRASNGPAGPRLFAGWHALAALRRICLRALWPQLHRVLAGQGISGYNGEACLGHRLTTSSQRTQANKDHAHSSSGSAHSHAIVVGSILLGVSS